jgi:hypothetical protein
MDNILNKIRAGEFDCDEDIVTLRSGVKIWIGVHGYERFYPLAVKFSFWERRKLRKALKAGMLVKANA